MDKGIYTALSGGLAKSHEIELIANNIANANTPGFKRDTATFNEYLTEVRRPDSPEGLQRETQTAALQDPRPQGDKSFVEMDGIYTVFRQGPLRRTNAPLDLALNGKGFFEVLTPQGVRYTRQGNFSLSKDGVLVTASGFPVLGRPEGAAPNAPVAGAPEARTIRFGTAGGHIDISATGAISQAGAPLGQLSVVEFQEAQWLEKVGNAFFRNTEEKNLKAGLAQETAVEQGMIELSNVNAVHEMTRLIEATRAYESHLQAIKTFQEIDGRSVNEIARKY
ncbi:flagellar basal-body rod protein FlgF [bacterium]|nr:flagellar basal-body rod protein FlgF [bacterium]